MSIEELRGVKFSYNQVATEKAMDDIMFDKYENELNRIFEDEVITNNPKQRNRKNGK